MSSVEVTISGTPQNPDHWGQKPGSHLITPPRHVRSTRATRRRQKAKPVATERGVIRIFNFLTVLLPAAERYGGSPLIARACARGQGVANHAQDGPDKKRKAKDEQKIGEPVPPDQADDNRELGHARDADGH